MNGEKDPNGTIFKGWSSGGNAGGLFGPIVKLDKKIFDINGISVEAEVTEYGPSRMEKNEYSYYKRVDTTLKGYPEFTLEFLEEAKDTYKGQNYQRRIQDKLVDISRQKILDKEVLVFKKERIEEYQNVVRNKSIFYMSPDIPEYLIKYTEEYYNEKGELTSRDSRELIDMGISLKEVNEYNKNKKRVLTFNSKYEQWRIQQMVEQGYSRQEANNIVRHSLTQESVFQRAMKFYEDVNSTWQMFKKNPTPENRNTLIEKLNKETLFPRSPEIEVLAGQMFKNPDAEIELNAAITLAKLYTIDMPGNWRML